MTDHLERCINNWFCKHGHGHVQKENKKKTFQKTSFVGFMYVEKITRNYWISVDRTAQIMCWQSRHKQLEPADTQLLTLQTMMFVVLKNICTGFVTGARKIQPGFVPTSHSFLVMLDKSFVLIDICINAGTYSESRQEQDMPLGNTTCSYSIGPNTIAVVERFLRLVCLTYYHVRNCLVRFCPRGMLLSEVAIWCFSLGQMPYLLPCTGLPCYDEALMTNCLGREAVGSSLAWDAWSVSPGITLFAFSHKKCFIMLGAFLVRVTWQEELVCPWMILSHWRRSWPVRTAVLLQS